MSKCHREMSSYWSSFHKCFLRNLKDDSPCLFPRPRIDFCSFLWLHLTVTSAPGSAFLSSLLFSHLLCLSDWPWHVSCVQHLESLFVLSSCPDRKKWHLFSSPLSNETSTTDRKRHREKSLFLTHLPSFLSQLFLFISLLLSVFTHSQTHESQSVRLSWFSFFERHDKRDWKTAPVRLKRVEKMSRERSPEIVSTCTLYL